MSDQPSPSIDQIRDALSLPPRGDVLTAIKALKYEAQHYARGVACYLDKARGRGRACAGCAGCTNKEWQGNLCVGSGWSPETETMKKVVPGEQGPLAILPPPLDDLLARLGEFLGGTFHPTRAGVLSVINNLGHHQEDLAQALKAMGPALDRNVEALTWTERVQLLVGEEPRTMESLPLGAFFVGLSRFRRRCSSTPLLVKVGPGAALDVATGELSPRPPSSPVILVGDEQRSGVRDFEESLFPAFIVWTTDRLCIFDSQEALDAMPFPLEVFLRLSSDRTGLHLALPVFRQDGQGESMMTYLGKKRLSLPPAVQKSDPIKYLSQFMELMEMLGQPRLVVMTHEGIKVMDLKTGEGDPPFQTLRDLTNAYLPEMEGWATSSMAREQVRRWSSSCPA